MTPQRAPVRLDRVGTAGQPVVETARLKLRPVRRSDMGPIELHAGRREVAEMTTSIPHPLPPGAVDAFVTRCLAGVSPEAVWTMDATASSLGEFVGLVSLTRLDASRAEIGYWVAPLVWNTGLASEAVRGLVEANPLGLATILGTVFQDNPASARVLTNAGFAYTGEGEAFSVARGAVVPQWTYRRDLA
jgi:RimJ/RimL family protein N-acetyltransferase